MKTKNTSKPEQKLTVRMSQETIEMLRQLAIEHKRSLNSEIEWGLQLYVKNEVRKGDATKTCNSDIVV
jgi:predicted HicB family RNase H-like nuclease